MFTRNKETAANTAGKAVNLFAENTHIKGDIKTVNDIRIDGTVEGTITSDAKVVIGPGGRVNGNIVCLNADISGSVNGSIEVGELLFLKSTAAIEGDITTNKLVVEAGARFNGFCNMGQKWHANEASTDTHVQRKEAAII
jgi:cytoskeletal protein CcmA (bactofilin family)